MTIQNELRPMGVGDIIDKAISLYKNNFKQLFPIGGISTGILLIFIIIAAVVTAIIIGLTGGFSNISPTALIGIVALITPFVLVFVFAYFYVTYLAQGAIIHLVSELFLQHQITWKESIKFALKKMKAFLWALSLVGLIMAALYLPPLLALVALGLYNPGNAPFAVLVIGLLIIAVVISVLLSLRYMFVPQVVMLENKNGMEALKRSAWLYSKQPGKIIGVMTLIAVLPNILLSILGSIPFLGLFLNLAGSILIFPLVFIGMTLVYYDTRIRAEGFDLLILAEELGGTVA